MSEAQLAEHVHRINSGNTGAGDWISPLGMNFNDTVITNTGVLGDSDGTNFNKVHGNLNMGQYQCGNGIFEGIGQSSNINIQNSYQNVYTYYREA